VATVSEQVAKRLDDAHGFTDLGQETADRAPSDIIPDDVNTRTDALAFLTDMVLGLEDAVRLIAASIET
jgi:hypothetical protein